MIVPALDHGRGSADRWHGCPPTDWAGVEAFAGPGGTTSFVPEDARALLSRFEEHSQHYQVVGSHDARRWS